MENSKSSAKREFHSDTSLAQETLEKKQVNNLNFHLKQLQKKKK